MDALVNAFTRPIEYLTPRLPGAFLTLVVGFIFIQFILLLTHTLLRTLRITRSLQDILQSLVAIVLWLGLTALIFQNLGLGRVLLALSGSVAIIGLGIAAGGNKLLADVLAGLSLAKNRNFKIGQRIKIDAVEGQIHSLDVRKVRVLDKNGGLYVIPNTKFDEQIWQILPDKK